MPLAMGLLVCQPLRDHQPQDGDYAGHRFLMLENAIALLAVLATYGVPLIVEVGVFLDVLMVSW